jgi:hypothetical protein
MSDERICGGPSDSPWRDEEQDSTEESGPLDGYHPMVRDFILGQGCFSQEGQIEAARRVGEKMGKAAAKAMEDGIWEQFAAGLDVARTPRSKCDNPGDGSIPSAAASAPLAPKDVISILAEGDRRLRELASKAMAKCLKEQFEALDKCWEIREPEGGKTIPETIFFAVARDESDTAQADATPCEARDDRDDKDDQIQETLSLPMFKARYDGIIADAIDGRRRMPWLFGKPATELSKRELLALAILQAEPMSSYVSKEES